MTPIASILESVGTYLPSQIVTTKEIVEGCARPVRVPLERLTGIRSRHFAGGHEYALELASNAIEDCLRHSGTPRDQYDLLISANISRYDGLNRVGYEPSSAVVLKSRVGLPNAIAFDISNACASMWTAVFVADAFIQSGAVRNAMVVSGEFISHLTRTAQLEIEGYLDPQLASLTLGDAGVAVSMKASDRRGEGFNELELYTLGKYSRLCIAKPSDQPHGGAVMHTDAVKVTAAIVPHAAAHAEHILRGAGHHVKDIQHIIPHQTSRLTIKGALDEIAKRFDSDCSAQMIDNLELRGNTASTTHFLAFRDNIDNGRIRTGDKVLFAISGSGQTTGTAVYTCNDLPDRIRAACQTNGAPANGSHPATAGGKPDASGDPPPLFEDSASDPLSIAMAVPFRFESVTVAYPANGEAADTLTLLKRAAHEAIDRQGVDSSTIELLISTGVYRSEFLTEPALAALLAGDLDINADQDAIDPVKTFAFDLLNGSVGFLNACHLICELGRAGKIERAMVVASEVENNTGIEGTRRVNVTEMASAVILCESEDGETGFHAFRFHEFPDLRDRYETFANTSNQIGRCYLETSIAETWKDDLLPKIADCVSAFLSEHDLTIESIDWWIPPQVETAYVQRLCRALGIDASKTVLASDVETDAFTSAVPLAMLATRTDDRYRAKPGDVGLIVNIGSGLQVATALYRF